LSPPPTDLAVPSIPHLGQPVNNSLQNTSLPANALDTRPSDLEVSLPANASATPATGLQSGKAFLLPADFDKGQYCFTNNDRSMMRFYSLCADNAGFPRYLMDQVLAQLRIERSRNQFDPSHSSLTKRDVFMGRMHRKFQSPPPEPIQVQLESSSEPITMYCFNALQMLQEHLLQSDLYGDVNKLNVHSEHRWDQTFLPPLSHMREVTEGSWYKQVISKYIKRETVHQHSDLDSVEEDPYQPFVIFLELYQDATGTDNKEGFSLAPVVLTTGLLKSKFNSDHLSRFIIGYIPSFSNKKLSADNTRRGGTLRGFDSSVCDYHKCLPILLNH
jgi:hypothetical protein